MGEAKRKKLKVEGRQKWSWTFSDDNEGRGLAIILTNEFVAIFFWKWAFGFKREIDAEEG